MNLCWTPQVERRSMLGGRLPERLRRYCFVVSMENFAGNSLMMPFDQPQRRLQSVANVSTQRPRSSLNRNVAPPRSFSSNTADTPFSPSAFGTAVHCTSTASHIHPAIRYSAPPRT